jgi:hypothetical protein
MWRALVNAVINLQTPENAGKLLSGYTAGDLSSSIAGVRAPTANPSVCL